ncbi:MAG TPA: hypothetical protein VGO18_38135 [Steroidobacteraceae bacterium]|nr:hypothetical protein [Steroidobacteraceae bacterium]
MDYEAFFKQQLDTLHAEARYRIFADIERSCGHFPRAYHHRVGGEVTVWCSNDYLGMGQRPAVLKAMMEAVQALGAGSHPQQVRQRLNQVRPCALPQLPHAYDRQPRVGTVKYTIAIFPTQHPSARY